jgi:hypothetical protein
MVECDAGTGTTIYILYPYGTKPGGFFADAFTLKASKKSGNYSSATQLA